MVKMITVSITRPLVLWDGREEGQKAGSAEEFGDKDGSVGLSLSSFEGSEALPENAVLVAALSKNATPVTTHDVFIS
ncbi:hypothetical protein Hanom_Chr12g01150081 [Helianthus anomalus]